VTFPTSVADWRAWIKRSLLTGLAAVLPAVLTVYILWLLFRITGAFFAMPVDFLASNLFGRSLGSVATTLIGAVLTVGLVEYPRPGMYALCFITSREPWRLDDGDRGQLLSVYLPTTPNPTSGYLLLVPKEDVRLLDLTVDEAARIIISGGSLPIPDRRLRGAAGSDPVACPPHSSSPRRAEAQPFTPHPPPREVGSR
jgi:uncharacterized membrane protein